MTTRLILDNGGGYTLQLDDYAHGYVDARQVAADIAAYLRTGNTSEWDGHDDDAMRVDPTDNEIRNGGYRVINIDRETDTVTSIAASLAAVNGWDNAEKLAEKLSKDA